LPSSIVRVYQANNVARAIRVGGLTRQENENVQMAFWTPARPGQFLRFPIWKEAPNVDVHMPVSELPAVSTADFHPLATHVSINAAATILDKGRASVYVLLGTGKLAAIKDGKRTMVLIESIKAYQAALLAQPPAQFAPPKHVRENQESLPNVVQRHQRPVRRRRRNRNAIT